MKLHSIQPKLSNLKFKRNKFFKYYNLLSLYN